MKNVGITACSNGLSTSMRDNVDNLAKKLEDISLKPIFSEYIMLMTRYSKAAENSAQKL